MSGKKKDGGGERILVLNPGSTSTKLAVFDADECLFEDKIEHTSLDLSHFDHFNRLDARPGTTPFLHDHCSAVLQIRIG